MTGARLPAKVLIVGGGVAALEALRDLAGDRVRVTRGTGYGTSSTARRGRRAVRPRRGAEPSTARDRRRLRARWPAATWPRRRRRADRRREAPRPAGRATRAAPAPASRRARRGTR